MKILLFVLGLFYRLGPRVTILQFIRWWAEKIESKDPFFGSNKTYRSLRAFDRKRRNFRHCLCCSWSVLPGYPHNCDEAELAELLGGITRRVLAGEIGLEAVDSVMNYHADRDPMGTPNFDKPPRKSFWDRVGSLFRWGPLTCLMGYAKR